MKSVQQFYVIERSTSNKPGSFHLFNNLIAASSWSTDFTTSLNLKALRECIGLYPPSEFFYSFYSFELLWLLLLFSARQHAERAICYRPSVWPSVRPSVTRVNQSKTVERIIEILSPSDRPNILVFRHQRSLCKSDSFTPNGGAKYKGGSKN